MAGHQLGSTVQFLPVPQAWWPTNGVDLARWAARSVLSRSAQMMIVCFEAVERMSRIGR